MAYVPPLSLVLSLIGEKQALSPTREYKVPGAVLDALLRTALAQVEIDEKTYVRDYPDLRRDLKPGSGTEHYRSVGYFENRSALPSDFDPQFYLHNNFDVSQSISNGSRLTPEDHYRHKGFTELRAPNAAAQSVARLWTDLATKFRARS